MLRRSASTKAVPPLDDAKHAANGGRANGFGRDTSASTRRRAIFIVGPLGALFLLVHMLSPARDGLSHLSGYAYLPGFSNRALHSRRTDVHLRRVAAKRRASAASVHGGAYPPANFSEVAPFTFCPSYGETDELAQLYGPEQLLKTRAHVGSPERIRKVIRRAMAGLPITIAVLGGSISSCHGLDATQAHPLGDPIGPNCYPHRLFAWLNDVFPHPANELTNGALRRTGTSYFGYCSEMHMPDRVDLVVMEFDTEDPSDETAVASTELLVRSLLLRPESPAVIMLGHFSPQTQGEYGFAGPDMYHSSVAQFYDIPYLSMKGLLYEEYLLNPQKVRQAYFIDPILANGKGHELLADTIIAYIESEICQVWDLAAIDADLAGLPMPQVGTGLGLGIDDDASAGKGNVPAAGDDAPPALLGGKGLRKSGDAGLDAEDSGTSQTGGKDAGRRNSYKRIPQFRIGDRPHTIQHFREIKPACASANDMINPLPASIFAGSGWAPVKPKPDEEDERSYWFSDTPGSLLKIPIKVGAGDIAVYYLKGPASESFGSVLCWVDDNTGGAVELNGAWDRPYGQTMVQQVDQNVGKGSHYVVCELQGEPTQESSSKFAIYGVFST